MIKLKLHSGNKVIGIDAHWEFIVWENNPPKKNYNGYCYVSFIGSPFKGTLPNNPDYFKILYDLF